MSKRLALVIGLGFCFLSACSSKDKASQVFAQLPGPTPIESGKPPTPAPTPSTSPRPRPVPTVSPRPVPPTPVACDSSALLPWARWSTFTSQSAKFQGMDVREAIAARNLVLSEVEQGYYSPRDVSRVDVVSDTLDMEYVDVLAGSVTYASTLKIRDGVDVYGSLLKRSIVDFDQEKENLYDLQLKILDLKVNGAVTRTCRSGPKDCLLSLKGTNAYVNRFTIEPDQLTHLTEIEIDVPKKSTAVVVLNVQNLKWKDVTVKAPRETVWTLGLMGGKFTIDFMTLPGVVVAATSTFEMDDALLMGRVLSLNFSSAQCRDERACSTIDSSDTPEKICL